MFETLKNRTRDLALRTGIVLASAVPAIAMADGTDPFTDALTNATTKVGTYAAALVGLAAVAVAFMIGMKYVKKIVKAS
jgi:hypothetical protein